MILTEENTFENDCKMLAILIWPQWALNKVNNLEAVKTQ